MKTAFFLFFLTASLSPAYPQETISIEEIIREVIDKNPEIKAAESLSKAYKTRVPQSYFPANPSVEFERMYLPDSGEKNVLLKQELENPYKLLLMRSIFRKDADYYKKLFQAKRNRVVAETKQAFYRYYLSERYEKIFRETADILTGFSKTAEAKYAAGHARQTDVLKSQVELSKTLNMLVTIKQEKETARALLNSLMDRDTESPLPPPEEPEKKPVSLDLSILRAKALQMNPEIEAMKINIARAGDLLKSGKSQWLPDFMLAYRTRSAGGSVMDNTYDISIGLTIPLFLGKNASIVRQARAEKQMAEAEYKSSGNKLSFEIKNAIVQIETGLRLIELYETSVIPQAEQSLQIADSSYRANKIDFIDLLDAVRTLLDFKTDYYAYIARHLEWKAELERLIGENL
ncbi:MAG: TolC family protein [Elusimicrobia bacterium]|nr:TolC family protein [Elusimicrobiota bacterium]